MGTRKGNPLHAGLLAMTVALGGCIASTGEAAAADSASVEAEATAGYLVRGFVRGVGAVGLVLEDNGSDAIALSKDSIFLFQKKLANGQRYDVTVAQQPDGQTCSVTNGWGVIDADDTFPITVNCVDNALTVGGSIEGLRSSILITNGDDVLSVVGDGRFFMTARVGPGTRYELAIAEQPTEPRQSCSIENAYGMTAGEDVVDVKIVCEDL